MDVQVVRDAEELDDPRGGQHGEAQRDPLHLGGGAAGGQAEAEQGTEREYQRENSHADGVPATVVRIPTAYAERQESMARHPAGKGGCPQPRAPRLHLVGGGR